MPDIQYDLFVHICHTNKQKKLSQNRKKKKNDAHIYFYDGSWLDIIRTIIFLRKKLISVDSTPHTQKKIRWNGSCDQIAQASRRWNSTNDEPIAKQNKKPKIKTNIFKRSDRKSPKKKLTQKQIH